jgi:heme/copper-type cytochrome/quinol oxidase subunit 2
MIQPDFLRHSIPFSLFFLFADSIINVKASELPSNSQTVLPLYIVFLVLLILIVFGIIATIVCVICSKRARIRNLENNDQQRSRNNSARIHNDELVFENFISTQISTKIKSHSIIKSFIVMSLIKKKDILTGYDITSFFMSFNSFLHFFPFCWLCN